MRPIILAVLVLVAAPGFAADRAPRTRPGLSPLAEKYAREREALLQDYAAKRRALVSSPGYSSSSPAGRKAALDELSAEEKARDADLVSDYDAELRRGRAAADADAAKDQNVRRSGADEQRIRAAQDAARSQRPR
ncbi:MAG TPA: hypothetical protein VN915_06345 [Elusimicrobiota bacterium]|nr:hypothetical protein [Elusimicrobiota bacterium]